MENISVKISNDNLQKAKELLDQCVVANMHDDFLTDVLYLHQAGETDVIKNKYLTDFRRAGLDVVVAAIFIGDMFLSNSFEVACSQIGALYNEVGDGKNGFVVATTYNEILKAKADGNVAIMLSLEGLEPIGYNEELLQVFYNLGVRFVGPTWARRNMCCDGTILTDSEKDSNGGFTTFGLSVLAQCQKLGILMDASHISDQAFLQMADNTDGIIFASHSNSRTLFDISRNIPDSQVLEIAKRGGVVGLNGCNVLLADNDEQSTHMQLAQNALYYINLVGAKHIAFGFDFFENLNMYVPFTKQRRPVKDVVCGYSDVENFVALLLQLGITETEVKDIIGNSFMTMLSNSPLNK